MAGETGYIRFERCGHGGDLDLQPASYGPGGRGGRIAFGLERSPAGSILVGVTDAGVCWLGIHEDGAYLEAQLRGDLPHARISRDGAAADDMARRIGAYLDGAPLDLPLDIRATPFQAAVWRELCRIPFGATRSYGDIARQIGRPSASRAVGHANGSNPVAIVIPCHRAIGADGSLTGYRWGVEYKRRLLDHEIGVARRLLAGDLPALPLFARGGGGGPE